MPVYTVKEISEQCKITPNNIHVYIGRGKLIKRKDGYIDDSHPLNVKFLAKHRDKNDKKVNISLKKSKETEAGSKKKTPKKKNGNDPDLDVVKKLAIYDELRIKKLEQEIETTRIKNQKELKELIQIELVKKIFNIHITNLTQIFYNLTENYTTEICNRLGANRTILSEFRGKLKKLINNSTIKAREQSEKDLQELTENKE